ncbi:unnamed protein product [Acanthoscelides obtectus]|uniref:Uncharacterized protein n=1 Tax=Acanthoscelides obtectus TaxID=200917 RepID=A0A9P0MM36_ACAOB|nr:unnamed protein product [Acanthoscelides obtectus]CAK1627216.1 hypothetical protein AOBTE_LOCUS4399 [Acanthoscelides obtectus]
MELPLCAVAVRLVEQFARYQNTSCQEDDVSTYVQHLNALYSDFESRFEDILTMVIPPWIINPYGDIEETNVIIQEELTELSTNEELKFSDDLPSFWLLFACHWSRALLFQVYTGVLK